MKIKRSISMLLIVFATAVAGTGCGPFNKLLKSGDNDKIYAEGKNVQQKLEELNNGQGEMKEYTHHRYIDYLTLEESVCFEPLARFGDVVCPTLGRIDKSVKEDLVQAINRSKVIFVNNSQQSAEDSTPKHETTTAPQTPNTEQK